MNFPFHFLLTLEATKWRLSRSRAGTRDSSWRHHRLRKNDLVEISQSLEHKTHNSQATTPSLFCQTHTKDTTTESFGHQLTTHKTHMDKTTI